MYKILGSDGKEYGPITADTLRQWVNEGRANAQSQVQPEGGAWIALGQLPEFSWLFNSNPVSGGIPGPIGVVSSAPPPINTLALVGFILSILGITLGLCCCYGLPFSIPGITCSIIGLVQIRKEPERYKGKGFAVAGIIVGIASMVLIGALLIFGIALNWSEFQKEFQKM